MRTFILRTRKGTTCWEKIRAGGKEHFEIIAHFIMNAFFVSNDFRKEVEVYIVLDSSPDFPRTVKLSGHDGLSIPGFHESAIFELIEKTLKSSQGLQKDETRQIAPGVQIHGFGFEKLTSKLLETRSVYLLEPKGEEIRTHSFEKDPVFILSDHLSLPKNNIKTFKRRGLKTVSLGKKMLFASQCVVIIHHELDIKNL